MINIIYSHNNDTHCLDIIGHAQFAKYGSDIVCAAVSMLYMALIDKMWELYELKAFDTIDTYSNDGKSHLVVKDFNNAIHRLVVDELFSMVINGLKELSNNYPNHVKVSTLPDEENS